MGMRLGVPGIYHNSEHDSSLHMYTVPLQKEVLTVVVRRGIEVVRRAVRLGSSPCQSKY